MTGCFTRFLVAAFSFWLRATRESGLKRTADFASALLALTTVAAFAQTPPAGYVSMPQGITCLGYATVQQGHEGAGWTLQSIGSLRCGTSGVRVTSYREVALASHDATGGRIQTNLFGIFVAMAQPASGGTSTLSGAGVQFGPGGTVTPLSTDERPSTYSRNQGGTRLQLAISQGAVQAFNDFLQTGALLAAPSASSAAPATGAATPSIPDSITPALAGC